MLKILYLYLYLIVFKNSDYSTNSKEDCKTCDDNGECICR